MFWDSNRKQVKLIAIQIWSRNALSFKFHALGKLIRLHFRVQPKGKNPCLPWPCTLKIYSTYLKWCFIFLFERILANRTLLQVDFEDILILAVFLGELTWKVETVRLIQPYFSVDVKVTNRIYCNPLVPEYYVSQVLYYDSNELIRLHFVVRGKKISASLWHAPSKFSSTYDLENTSIHLFGDKNRE